MSTSIKYLIEILKTKDPKAEVEFIVVETNDNMIAMDVKAKSRSMVRLLKLFGDK